MPNSCRVAITTGSTLKSIRTTLMLCSFQKTAGMPVPSQGHYGFHSFPVVD